MFFKNDEQGAEGSDLILNPCISELKKEMRTDR